MEKLRSGSFVEGSDSLWNDKTAQAFFILEIDAFWASFWSRGTFWEMSRMTILFSSSVAFLGAFAIYPHHYHCD